MADNQIAGIEERKSKQYESAGMHAPFHSQEPGPDSHSPLSFVPPTLMGDNKLARRGNISARTSVMQRAQQTHGNRAVQRVVAVQRCGDTPCGCSAEEKLKHAMEHGSEMLPVSRMAEFGFGEMPVQRAVPVQRRPPEAPADPNYTKTSGGDAYVGPGGGAGVGGLVSYGCYCGPGGDAVTGSRCGVGAPPKDEIDAKCMRHDSDYNKAGVDSGSTPGTVNMFTDLQGWLKSEEADRRLADTVGAEMDASPGSYSPSARLYGQGIKGIFGGRANISHGMKWGMEKYGEAAAGLGGAYDDMTNWGSSKYDEASKGIESFMKGASTWNSAEDVIGGVAGGASDAANWLGKAGSEAFGGATKALGSAGSWLADTASSAASGLGKAALGMGKWGLDTAGAVADVGIDLAGRGINAAGEAIGDAASWAGGKAKGAWETVTSWF